MVLSWLCGTLQDEDFVLKALRVLFLCLVVVGTSVFTVVSMSGTLSPTQRDEVPRLISENGPVEVRRRYRLTPNNTARVELGDGGETTRLVLEHEEEIARLLSEYRDELVRLKELLAADTDRTTVECETDAGPLLVYRKHSAVFRTLETGLELSTGYECHPRESPPWGSK